MTSNATLDPADPLDRQTPGRKIDRHLHQVDLFRVLVFAAVIMVHTLSKTNGDASQSAGALQDVLHFTREAFFALSGFILVYGHNSSGHNSSGHNSSGPIPGRGFLSRRMRLVAVPYLAWTLIYWAVDEALNTRSALLSIRELGYDIVTGGASYHLYFLLVTMQIYLVFRLLLRLLYATQGHHLALLVGTAVFEVALTGWLHYIWTPGGAGGAFVAHADLLLPSYLLWVVGGGVAALHREAFDAWVRSHSLTVGLFFLGALALVEVSYVIELMNGADPVHASDVLQPFTLVWSAAAIVALYAVGLRWAADRDGVPRESRVLGARVAQASLGSFGVFLVHPLVLHLLVAHGLGPLAFVMPKIAATLLAYALTVFGAVILVAIFLHTRLATTLTGRPRIKTPAGPAPGHRAHGAGLGRLVTPARVGLMLSMVVFGTSVVALSHANIARQNSAAAADEFNPVNSLVTPTTAPSAGATVAPVVSGPPIEQSLTLMSGGIQRTYLLVTPNGPTTGLPLLVFLHGVTTTAGQELARDGFLPLAATGKAVLVYPGGVQGSWDAGDGCCGAALDQHVDDVSFIHTLVSTVQANQHTDVKRTYLDGYSNGAKLVWTIACTSPAGFAGFAEYGGNPDPCPTRVQAPIFWGVGMLDGTEPIAGKPADTRGPHPAVQPELSNLLARNGCTGPGTSTTASSATVTSWTTCAEAPVTYVVWKSADHHWPRPPTVDAIGSAATLMWNFFSVQHL